MGAAGVGAGAYAVTPPRQNCVPHGSPALSAPAIAGKPAPEPCPPGRAVPIRRRHRAIRVHPARGHRRRAPATRTGRGRSSRVSRRRRHPRPAFRSTSRSSSRPPRRRARASRDLGIDIEQHIARRLRLDRSFHHRPAAERDAAHPLRRARGLARHGRADRLRLPHHRRRALLGRARLLRLHARADRARHRSADRRARRHVPASWSSARSPTSA